MKKKQLIISVLMAILFVSSGCGKKASETISQPPVTASVPTSEQGPAPMPTDADRDPIEASTKANHDVKPLELRASEDFAIIAYTSITSTPLSSVTGKVGLKPGIRSLIMLNPTTEVVGGVNETYAADDLGESLNYITKAREDLILAYRDAMSRPIDDDKNELDEGIINKKKMIFSPGVYRWSKGLVIENDIVLDGSDTDVWLIQIIGNLKIAKNVRIFLKNGALAKNIFWAVTGKVTLESRSSVVGTIMSQLTFEIKEKAQITGRVFVKNGKLLMDQSIITKP